MPTHLKKVATKPEPSHVLRKAFLRASSSLELERAQIESMLRISKATLSRMINNEDFCLNPDSNEGEKALLFLRVYRSLDALFGGNQEQCRAWMHYKNTHLEKKPVELLTSYEGLSRVARYLDAFRGKV